MTGSLLNLQLPFNEAICTFLPLEFLISATTHPFATAQLHLKAVTVYRLKCSLTTHAQQVSVVPLREVMD